MITNFDIIGKNKKIQLDNDTVSRLLNYDLCRDLYDGNFKRAFSKTYDKICKRYPLDSSVSQAFIELNLFYALTDFYKNFITNNGLYVNVDDVYQKDWDEIAENNNFISVLKEVFIDTSRFGNGLFKVTYDDFGTKIISVSPDTWFPVFEKGNINNLKGHIIINTLSDFINGQEITFKLIEKHKKGSVEHELWRYQNGSYCEKLNTEIELGIPAFDDFSELWNDFLIFPVKNTSESDNYFGSSDYLKCKSVVEELILTVSQNSKILNRHANPKLTGSNENLEYNPLTGKSDFPNRDFIPVGRDGIKAEYITADLQENAVSSHIQNMLKFFFILTKTPPQAYGIDISANMSGESLRKVFLTPLTKIDDIKQVSFNNTLKNLVKCSMALNHTPVNDVQLDWGNPIPTDKSELIQNTVARINSGTLSQLSAISELDNLSLEDAMIELNRINENEVSLNK